MENKTSKLIVVCWMGFSFIGSISLGGKDSMEGFLVSLVLCVVFLIVLFKVVHEPPIATKITKIYCVRQGQAFYARIAYDNKTHRSIFLGNDYTTARQKMQIMADTIKLPVDEIILEPT